MKITRKTKALVIFVLVLVTATVAAAAENLVAPQNNNTPTEKKLEAPPETVGEFDAALEAKLKYLKTKRQDNIRAIINKRDAFADKLEQAGFAEWAAKNREFTKQYREQTSPTPSATPNNEIPTNPPIIPPVLSEMPEQASQTPQSIALESLIVWGAIGVLWMVALAGLRGLRNKTKLRRLAWLLIAPTAPVLMLIAATLRPSLNGRELLPAFFAPGNFLALLFCALAYITIRLFRKKAWKRGGALVCGVLLVCGLLALGATVGMSAIPEEISGVKITGTKTIDSSGTVTIESIASDKSYNVAWSLKNLRVRTNVPALMWGNLEGVDIRIGEVDVFIDRSLPSPPKKEGESEPLTIARVIKHLRSLGAVNIEKITVRMARQDKEPLMIFEGGTSVTRYSADEIGGEITGRILSMSNLAVKWRGDMAQRSIITQYDFGGLEIDTDILAGMMPGELGSDLAASGWKIGCGLSVSGEVKLAEGAKPEWFANVQLNASMLQWPGLPLPLIGIAGEVFVDQNGASIHNMRGRVAANQQGTQLPDGVGDFVMAGEISTSGNGLIEISSSGFPISDSWLAMIVGEQDLLNRLGLTGHADFRSILRISIENGVPKIENISTNVMPSRLLVSPTEPKVDVGIDLMAMTADTERMHLWLGDSNLAGGKLFGNPSASLDNISASSGWIAFKDIQFQKLQGLSSGTELKGRMHGELAITDATMQSAKSFSGTVWITDVNTDIDPVLSKLVASLLTQLNIKKLDSKTCDIYCAFTAGKDGLKIQELRAFSTMLRIDAEGTIDYAGNLKLNGSLRLGSGLLAQIPGLGKVLGDILAGKKFGLTSFKIDGNYDDPKIKINPLNLTGGLGKIIPKLLPEKSEDTTEP